MNMKAAIGTTETLVTLNLSQLCVSAVSVYADAPEMRCVRARLGSTCRRSALT